MKNLWREGVSRVWFVAIALTIISSMPSGGTATPGSWAWLLLMSLMPPAIVWAVRSQPRDIPLGDLVQHRERQDVP